MLLLKWNYSFISTIKHIWITENNLDHSKYVTICPSDRPTIERFLKFGVFSRNLSIDEQMIQYYGQHFLKQFIREKPIWFGYKNWAMCCSSTGYCFYFDLYEGKLMETLTERNVSGTVRINHPNKFPLSTDEILKKKEKS